MFWPQWQQGFLPESLENLALIAGKSMTLFDTREIRIDARLPKKEL